MQLPVSQIPPSAAQPLPLTSFSLTSQPWEGLGLDMPSDHFQKRGPTILSFACMRDTEGGMACPRANSHPNQAACGPVRGWVLAGLPGASKRTVVTASTAGLGNRKSKAEKGR